MGVVYVRYVPDLTQQLFDYYHTAFFKEQGKDVVTVWLVCYCQLAKLLGFTNI